MDNAFLLLSGFGLALGEGDGSIYVLFSDVTLNTG